jgi:hypothetical protein
MRPRMPALPIARLRAIPANELVPSASTCPASVRAMHKLSIANKVADAEFGSSARTPGADKENDGVVTLHAAARIQSR